MKKCNKGFTLIELLIVLAIIGTVTSFVMVNLVGVRERGRDGQRKSDMQQMRTAFEIYRADQGSYPAAPLPACGSSLTSGGTTYIPKIPCDPTGTGQHVYSYTTTGSTYTLTSCLENERDGQKDRTNAGSSCNGSTNWSYTLTNP